MYILAETVAQGLRAVAPLTETQVSCPAPYASSQLSVSSSSSMGSEGTKLTYGT